MVGTGPLKHTYPPTIPLIPATEPESHPYLVRRRLRVKPAMRKEVSAFVNEKAPYFIESEYFGLVVRRGRTLTRNDYILLEEKEN